MRFHFQLMTQPHARIADSYDFKTMITVETGRTGKTESDRRARSVGLDKITDGTVTAGGADAKGAVEFHRGPNVFGEKGVVAGGQGIEQCAHLLTRGVQFPFMDIEHVHRR